MTLTDRRVQKDKYNRPIICEECHRLIYEDQTKVIAGTNPDKGYAYFHYECHDQWKRRSEP
jgi:hypothetical protein